jgi:hypothetical protein
MFFVPRKYLMEMRWESHVTHMGDERNAYMVMVEGPEGKRSLRRPRSSWK